MTLRELAHHFITIYNSSLPGKLSGHRVAPSVGLTSSACHAPSHAPADAAAAAAAAAPAAGNPAAPKRRKGLLGHVVAQHSSAPKGAGEEAMESAIDSEVKAEIESFRLICESVREFGSEHE